ncbi:hypothetical protein GCM10028807_51930 [Spirosoma daeguense]
MAKKSKTYRLSDETVELIGKLKDYLKESETDVIERAIKILYSTRKAVLDQDLAERLSKDAEN